MQAQQGQALQGSEFLVLDQLTPQPQQQQQQQRERGAEEAPLSVWAAPPPPHPPPQPHHRPPHASPPLPPLQEQAQPQQGGVRISVSCGSGSDALTVGSTGCRRHGRGPFKGSLSNRTCPRLALLVKDCVEMHCTCKRLLMPRQLRWSCLSLGRMHRTRQVCRQCGPTSGLRCPLQGPLTVTELEDEMRQQSLGAPGGSAVGPRGAASGLPPPAPPPAPPVRLPGAVRTVSYARIQASRP